MKTFWRSNQFVRMTVRSFAQGVIGAAVTIQFVDGDWGEWQAWATGAVVAGLTAVQKLWRDWQFDSEYPPTP